MIDIKGRDRADVLARLYNSAKVLGMGRHQAKAGDMSVEEAREIISKHGAPDTLGFDYLHGRVMKVQLAPDALDPGLYDRDNGEGAAAAALEDTFAAEFQRRARG